MKAIITLVALCGFARGAVGQQTGAVSTTRSPHGRLSQPCAACHAPEGWVPARISAAFDHAKTGFTLVGAHAQASCRGCHASLDFKGVASDCISCHRDVHSGELGRDCGRCHTMRSFLDRAAMTRAHQETRFPLTGSHRALDCEQCHVPAPQGRLAFVNRPSECVDCHRTDYAGTRNPDHQAGGLSTNCTQCHGTSAWPRARFSHAGTAFPLTGAHRAVACAQCHGDGVYSGKSELCLSCHQFAYDGTTDPPHQAAGFPTTCASCHTTVAWTGAKFDHAGTAFPLTGAHVPLRCNQCHADGVYVGKNPSCVSCHQAAYDAATDPNHRLSAFPTTCTDCHATTSWSGARYTAHDAAYFPIYSGAHRGRWSSCSTCHTVSGNYAQFTCLTCHGQQETNGHHSEVSGYSYNSQACYSCHPQGRKD
ncbi:MAG TPA: hypothetical protein VFO67_14340 [Gemmatimonadales bacterium]|nr:hypothetical protein [Gemmatimonadales bacterium]